MGYRVERIDPARLALVVVDMQNDFVAEDAPLEAGHGRAIIPRLKLLRSAIEASGGLVVYTRHAHRQDGTDMGRYRDLYPPIAAGRALIDGTPGAEIYPDLDPDPNSPVITKSRYSAFYGTELPTILADSDVDTVAVAGVTTEDCVHATARDAMFRDFWTLVVADASATYDHPDLGWGTMSADEVHNAALVVLAQSTADVVTTDELINRVTTANCPPWTISRRCPSYQ